MTLVANTDAQSTSRMRYRPGKGSGLRSDPFACYELTPRQNLHALLHRFLGLDSQNGVVVVADGVGDDGEGKVGQASGAGHRVCGVGEAVGHDGGGGDTGFVGGDGVMQTA